MNIESKLLELGLSLPPAPKPVGLYKPFVVSGSLVFVSGQISRDRNGEILAGRVGDDRTIEEGKKAAELSVLNALSVMHHFIGSEKIACMVKMTGFVQTAPDFHEVPAVLNRASEILGAVLGESGSHARSAVGNVAL